LVNSWQLIEGDSQLSYSPSFPHVLSGNPGETLTGPPIKHSGMITFGKLLSVIRYPRTRFGVNQAKTSDVGFGVAHAFKHSVLLQGAANTSCEAGEA